MQMFDEHNEKIMDELLKQYLLQQAPPEHEPQKLYDMSAQAIFSMQLPEVVNAYEQQQLKELTKKLSGNNTRYFKWLFNSILVIGGVIGIAYYGHDKISDKKTGDPVIVSENESLIKCVEQSQKNDSFLQVQNNEIAVEVGQTAVFFTSDNETPVIKTEVQGSDQVQEEKPGETKEKKNGIQPPVLTEKEIEQNNIRKERMIKALANLNKDLYVRVPMGTFKYKGDTRSVQDFYIQNSEVTNVQYRTFLYDLIVQKRFEEFKEATPDHSIFQKLNNANRALFSDSYFMNEPDTYNDYPVLAISRKAAVMYCNWLTIETNNYIKSQGKGNLLNDLRLPSDIEWAYAAHGGTEWSYPWDSDKVQVRGCNLCNYSVLRSKELFSQEELEKMKKCECKKGDSGSYTAAASRSKCNPNPTCQVYSYMPNKWKLYCISGNVAEMAWEFDPATKSVTDKAKTMGGSWSSTSEGVKIDSDDEYYGITDPSFYIGFRPIMTAPKAK